MQKNDIKPGMIVEYRNGTKALAVKVTLYIDNREEIIFIGFTGYMDMGSYDTNLLVTPDSLKDQLRQSDWDIMKVYDTDQSYSLGIEALLSDDPYDNPYKEFTLLWERKEPVEISLADISQKFNVPIDQIRIKK